MRKKLRSDYPYRHNSRARFRMCLVKICCKNNWVKKGEKYIAEVAISGIKDIVLLPSDAIHTENEQSFVWIIKDGKAHKQLVTLGEMNDKGIIAQGIEEQAMIILNGSEAIKENDLVKINYGN